MTKKKSRRRKHDGFLKYIYSRPQNARALFRMAAKENRNLREILDEVDLDTLEEIPEAYDDVEEHGEADIAFKVKAKTGEDIIFGILLEHKSSPSGDILAQIGRYTLKVMVDKKNPDIADLPTKAIVVYNGTVKWDPFRKYQQIRKKYNNRKPNFEFAFVNLANIDDETCFADENAEAAIGVITMKYAFDADAYEKLLPRIEDRLRTMGFDESSTLVTKIELYLSEYINPEFLERLKMAFQSIGQKLGFVSAADERRAMEKENRRLKAKVATQATKNANLVAENAAQAAALSAQAARIKELEAALADKSS